MATGWKATALVIWLVLEMVIQVAVIGRPRPRKTPADALMACAELAFVGWLALS